MNTQQRRAFDVFKDEYGKEKVDLGEMVVLIIWVGAFSAFVAYGVGLLIYGN